MRRRRNRDGRPPWLLVVLGAATAIGSLVPVAYLVDRAWSHGFAAARAEIFTDATLALTARSLLLAALVTGACVVIGVAAAVIVSRTTVPAAGVWRIVLALPLGIPSYLAAFAWLSVRPSLDGLGGATLVLVLTSYPYVFLTVLAALARTDPAQAEVARSLGLSAREVFLRVTLRQIRPAITAGGLLVALYVLSDFGAVGIMRYEAFTWVIYGAYNAGFNPIRAAVLALVLVAMAVALVAGESPLAGGRAAPVGAPMRRIADRYDLGRWTWAAVGFLALIAGASLGLPLASLGRWLARSINADFDAGALGAALVASLRLSLIAAILTTLVAMPVGVLAARYRSWTVTTIERSTYISHALPGIVIALAMVFVGIRALRPIYQQTPLLVLSYGVLFVPLAVGAIRTAVTQTPVRLEEVARSLGHSHLAAFTRVTARLAAPGVVTGLALVFLAVMKELPATLLLHPTGTDTLAMRLWQHTSVSDFGNAAPYAAALVVFAAVPTAILGWLSGRIGDVASR